MKVPITQPLALGKDYCYPLVTNQNFQGEIMTRPKTAFEVYLEAHPDQMQGNTNKPVMFFDPNTEQPGMRDFRVKQVDASAPDPDGYGKFTPGGMSDPKDSSVMGSAPTSPEPPEEPVVLPAPVVKEPPVSPSPASPASPVTAGPKSPNTRNART